jgi:hypothetical protein
MAVRGDISDFFLVGNSAQMKPGRLKLSKFHASLVE